jgi:hypothetical protein
LDAAVVAAPDSYDLVLEDHASHRVDRVFRLPLDFSAVNLVAIACRFVKINYPFNVAMNYAWQNNIPPNVGIIIIPTFERISTHIL